MLKILTLTFRKLTWPKFKYILITIFDSQAIFLNVLAFSVIKFDYVFIINMSTVFWTIMITWLFIKNYKYRLSHLFSTLLAMLGITITFIGLYGNIPSFIIIAIDNDFPFKDNYVGLFYCIGSSICTTM